jgi:hypothetical protein
MVQINKVVKKRLLNVAVIPRWVDEGRFQQQQQRSITARESGIRIKDGVILSLFCISTGQT